MRVSLCEKCRLITGNTSSKFSIHFIWCVLLLASLKSNERTKKNLSQYLPRAQSHTHAERQRTHTYRHNNRLIEYSLSLLFFRLYRCCDFFSLHFVQTSAVHTHIEKRAHRQQGTTVSHTCIAQRHTFFCWFELFSFVKSLSDWSLGTTLVYKQFARKASLWLQLFLF